MTTPPDTISCVECGGVAHLISYLAEDEVRAPGVAYVYRCADCMDRFDVVWEPAD